MLFATWYSSWQTWLPFNHFLESDVGWRYWLMRVEENSGKIGSAAASSMRCLAIPQCGCFSTPLWHMAGSRWGGPSWAGYCVFKQGTPRDVLTLIAFVGFVVGKRVEECKGSRATPDQIMCQNACGSANRFSLEVFHIVCLDLGMPRCATLV